MIAADAVLLPATVEYVAGWEADARARAAEHGHDLGPFARSASILTGARCVHCHRSAALDAAGDPLPGSLATTTPCTAGPNAPRYLARPAARRGRHYVIDRENPAGPPVAACKSRAAAVKMAAAMSAPAVEPEPVVEPDVDDRAALVVKARARVKRAAAALARAERDLAALVDVPPAAPVEVPNVARDILRAGCAAARARGCVTVEEVEHVPAAVVVTIDEPEPERLAPAAWAVLARTVPPFVCSARTRRVLAAGPRVLS